MKKFNLTRYTAEEDVISTYLKLWKHISYQRKNQLYLLLFLMIVSSFIEILSIGAVIPFLAIISSPEILFSKPIFNNAIIFLGLNDKNDLILFFSIFFCSAVLISCFFRLYLLKFTTKLAFLIGTDLSFLAYKKTLHQPFLFHVSRNSSEIIDTISNKTTTVIYSWITPALVIVSSIIMLLAAIIALILIQPIIAISTCLLCILFYVLVIKFTHKKLTDNGRVISVESSNVIKILQEGLGGIRDVLLDNNQAFYSAMYSAADTSLRKSQANNQFISQSPRYILETLGIIFITLFSLILIKKNGVEGAISFLGAFALAAQRLLPVVQQLFNAWATIRGSHQSVREAVSLLDQTIPKKNKLSKNKKLVFNNEIRLKNISYIYPNAKIYTLNNFSLRIKKGQIVGITGKSGKGKSTILDILMGLLIPQKGQMLVDGKVVTKDEYFLWQQNISHVPQSIYLADISIKENIAFGIPANEIDMDRVKWAAKQANLSNTINRFGDKYNTQIGERGARLSGGQRQRIGIARAFYKNASVIIFDEATNALDTKTEDFVMNSIYNLSKSATVIIVAHRLSILKKCDFIVNLT
jgi:ABC-type multidrug transport system fused ATPase/permease subunit